MRCARNSTRWSLRDTRRSIPTRRRSRAHRDLSRLDDTIARRQATQMSYGVVTLKGLGFEIELATDDRR